MELAESPVGMVERGLGRGRITLATYTIPLEWRDQPTKIKCYLACNPEPDQRVEADNVLCSAGLGALVQAVNWSGITDQNANMGSPFSAYYLAPLFGAIGTASVNNTGGAITLVGGAAADTALTTEVARSVVSSGGSAAGGVGNNASLTWLFLLPLPVAPVAITEAGVYAQASAALGTPAVPNGLLLDHALISPTVNQSVLQIVTLGLTITIGN